MGFFRARHVERALRAAKDTQLKMKLENMPVPLTAEMVDEYMGSVLEASVTGNLKVIKNLGEAMGEVRHTARHRCESS